MKIKLKKKLVGESKHNKTGTKVLFLEKKHLTTLKDIFKFKCNVGEKENRKNWSMHLISGLIEKACQCMGISFLGKAFELRLLHWITNYYLDGFNCTWRAVHRKSDSHIIILFILVIAKNHIHYYIMCIPLLFSYWDIELWSIKENNFIHGTSRIISLQYNYHT